MSEKPVVFVMPTGRTVNPSVFDGTTQFVVRCVDDSESPYSNKGIVAIVVNTTGTIPAMGERVVIRHQSRHSHLGAYERIAMPDGITRIRFWTQGNAAERKASKPAQAKPVQAAQNVPAALPSLLHIVSMPNYNGRAIEL